MNIFRKAIITGAAAVGMIALQAPPLQAQDTAPPAAEHGNWTLKQREEWLDNRLDKARDEGSIDHHEFERVRREMHDIREAEDHMRDSHGGQLTDNETADLEARLDSVAHQIHWLRENSFQPPW